MDIYGEIGQTRLRLLHVYNVLTHYFVCLYFCLACIKCSPVCASSYDRLLCCNELSNIRLDRKTVESYRYQSERKWKAHFPHLTQYNVVYIAAQSCIILYHVCTG